MNLRIVSIADQGDSAAAMETPAAAEAVHCQLRPHLAGKYAATMRRVFADGGEMCVAMDASNVVGVTVFRVYENTSQGKHLYVDDLVTDEAHRSKGIGRALLDHLTEVARQRGCEAVLLDSGTHRSHAHAFYFREGYTISAFHFVKRL